MDNLSQTYAELEQYRQQEYKSLLKRVDVKLILIMILLVVFGGCNTVSNISTGWELMKINWRLDDIQKQPTVTETCTKLLFAERCKQIIE